MIDCAEAVRQLWDYLENQLPTDERDRVDEHLAFCRRCCGEVEFAEELRGVMKGASGPHLPPDAAARLTKYVEELEDSGS